MQGPLKGRRVVELGGLGPVPFAAMLLADLGADIVRIERAGALFEDIVQIYHRGRPSLALDLKSDVGRELALRLISQADASLEGFRPGVMERLGLGPDDCLAHNPRLVYGRMTGWGQDGPLARHAGHDINYIGLTGALDQFRRPDQPPQPPMNVLGDFGGGALYLALGVVSGMLGAERTGIGCVVDAAVVDGVTSMLAGLFTRVNAGLWNAAPGTNIFDTGAPFYEVYETSDGRYVAVGAIEPELYTQLLRGLGINATDMPDQLDEAHWPETKRLFASLFATRTRDEWICAFEGIDAAVTPVLTLAEAPHHPHIQARGTYRRAERGWEPAAAPRVKAHQLGESAEPVEVEVEALAGWGLSDAEIDTFARRRG